ncbi:MAG: sulfatase-like hydrolase/transferase [Chitinophagales bacterium]|nr:sulfatase-like hydrolase/transferase [Chitinophagales bacterium]
MNKHSSLFITIIFCCYQTAYSQDCNLYPPKNLTVTGITTCSAIFNWTSSTTVDYYKIGYRKKNSIWSSWTNVGSVTSYKFTGLDKVTSYDFRVYSVCVDGTKSKTKKTSASTVSCSLPNSVIYLYLAETVQIEVISDCTYDSLRIRYSTSVNPTKYTYKNFKNSVNYVVDGLSTDSIYIFQVSTCPLSYNLWTESYIVEPFYLPNVVLIVIDDGRADYLSCNGAPAFFKTPNIDRIANEGVNFKNSFVMTSACAPSRASIATGLSTFHTGVRDNQTLLDTNYYTLPEVLGDNGYYTAMLGKNHQTFALGDNPEFDFYMTHGQKDNKFTYNGDKITIIKNDMLTLTDTAIGLIQRTTDPLFLWLAYKVPHQPSNPLPSFEGDYDSQLIPWAPDTAKYTQNYPDFLYNFKGGTTSIQGNYTLKGLDLDTTYRSVLEDMGGLDSCVGEIYKALDSSGKLNNTLLIFMSDNGYMMGTHQLGGKTMSFDPSMKIPLLIRYPLWFPDSTIISNEIALNVDITPTIYDAAHIEYFEPLDGISLDELFTGEKHRTQFYYFMERGFTSPSPTERAIRDQYYTYTTFTCSDTTEFLFDMVNDPLELTNLINNSAFKSVLNVYRQRLDSMKTACNDTINTPVPDCAIIHPFYLKELVEEEDVPSDEPLVYPTLVSDYVEVYFPWKQAKVTLLNERGQSLMTWKLTDQFSKLDFPSLPSGIYFLEITEGIPSGKSSGASITKKIVKQ